MKTLSLPLCSALLLVCLTALVALPVQAGMISTEEAVASQTIQADRDKVQTFLDRAEVQDQLQAMDVPPALAKSRVDALTPQETAALAQRIDTLPAGGALSTMDVVIILLVAILVAIAI
jgi:hypothetical protein